ncbi:MAG: 8-amino-7-oxononanoate synthase [Candidatus Nitrospinota bacterium M3_3B_026]
MTFDDALDRARDTGRLRSLRVLDGASGRTAVMDGREVVLFSSNDYLGLSGHPRVREAAVAAIEKSGWGAGASRLISGTRRAHTEFEEKIAGWLGKSAALFFSSGYAANVGLLTALLGKGDEVFADRLCHASILDGARFSGARLFRFAHNDPDSLERSLAKSAGRGMRLVVTEGVFSMDGDIAPLRPIAEIAKKHGAALMVDDAHGVGLFGSGGRGTVSEAGVSDVVDIHVAPLGKAMGGAGAAVLGSRRLIDGLVNFSRSFIYSTAPPPAAAAAASAAIDIVSGEEGDRLREALFSNAARARDGLRRLGYDTGGSASQITPVIIGPGAAVTELGERLFDGGLFVPAIRPPTVPEGSARLRVSITSGHTEKDLEKLLELFKISRSGKNF